jgi:hypothetical protein
MAMMRLASAGLEAITRKSSGSIPPICSSSSRNGWLFRQRTRDRNAAVRRDRFQTLPIATPSCRCSHVLSNNARMARRNSKERERRSLWLSPVLLPVAKRVHADAERFGEVSLRQTDEPTQRSHIAWLELSAHDALALAAAHGSHEICSAEFLRDAFHDLFSMYSE